MADGRRNNGGNSTKAKGVDRRKNEYKQAIHNSVSAAKVEKVMDMLYKKAIKHEDVSAGTKWLEYALGKPTQTINQNNTHKVEDFDIKSLYAKEA